MFQQHDPGLHAHFPLCSPDRLLKNDLPFPVSFIYGSNDWMDSRGSREIVRINPTFQSGQSQLHLLQGAGHQLWMGNPQGFIETVTNDLLGNVTHNFQIQRYTTNYVDEMGNFIELDMEWEQLHANETEESKERIQRIPTIWDKRDETVAAKGPGLLQPQDQERLAQAAAQMPDGDNDQIEGADPFGDYGSEVAD